MSIPSTPFLSLCAGMQLHPNHCFRLGTEFVSVRYAQVQIEYISTTSTLAFSTKENSHKARCHAHMAQSWAKYEGVERTLVHERETR